MSSFKYKTNRTKYRSDTRTLNEMHIEHIKAFQKKRQDLPDMEHKYKKYTKTLKKLNEGNEHSVKVNRLRCKLREKLVSLKRELENIYNNNDKINYYGKVHQVVKDYMKNQDGALENTHSEKNTDNTDNKDMDMEMDMENENNDGNLNDTDTEEKDDINAISSDLQKLYNMSRTQKKIKKKSRKRDTGKQIQKSGSILTHLVIGEIKEETVANQATLKNKYRALVDNNYIHTRNKITVFKNCKKCKMEMLAVPSEGSFVCNKCGIREYVVMESEIPSHTDALNEKPKYPYKKINHLIEKINQYQSKETTNVPPEIFATIRKEMKKGRKTKNTITVGFIKKVLKKYKYNNYYENRQYIFSKITGIPPPSLTREQIDQIYKMFRQLEEPYMKFRPTGRSNFLNYSFLINKILNIMNLPDDAKYFALLKSDEKLKTQESTWKKICSYLGWQYHSNIDSNVRYKIKITDFYINDSQQSDKNI